MILNDIIPMRINLISTGVELDNRGSLCHYEADMTTQVGGA